MDMFTPVTASIGGALIGVSAVMLMLFNGRIAGISGVLSGVSFGQKGDRLWRVMFVIGLIAAPLLMWNYTGVKPAFQMDASWPFIAIGGVLVGFGTRLGSGCTSGHGVCGLSRLSARSLFAVVLFMGTGMATVAGVKSLLGG